MVVEAGAGRDEANSAGTRAHKMENRLMFEVALTVKINLGTMDYADFQRASEELLRNYLS